jgi:hypothetical protein
LKAGLELGDEPVEVVGDPGVEIGQADRLASWGSVVSLTSRGVANVADGSGI